MAELTGQDEETLVLAARRGDKKALRALLGRNWNWLKALIYSVVGNVDETDDVLQEVCVRVISSIETLRQPERFRGWLATLARREALQYRRRRSRRPVSLSVESASSQPDERSGELFENIEQAEEHERILEAIRALPDKYSEAFMLVYSEELTYRQAAEALGVPITTLQIRLVRARRMIHERVVGRDTITDG